MTGVGAPPRARGDLRVLAGFTTLGVLAGIAAKAGDESGWRWAADLGSDPAAWVLAVALIGRYAPTAALAALRAAVFFAAMTVAYYGWAVGVLGFGYEPDLVVAWLGLSATAVAVFAAGTRWATRRSGVLPGAVLALVAGTVLAGGAVRRLWLWADGSVASELANPVQAVVEIAAVLVVVVVLPTYTRTRLWALALTLPMWWLASTLIQQLLYGTGVIR
jgi:hypothetical protein